MFWASDVVSVFVFTLWAMDLDSAASQQTQPDRGWTQSLRESDDRLTTGLIVLKWFIAAPTKSLSSATKETLKLGQEGLTLPAGIFTSDSVVIIIIIIIIIIMFLLLF